MFVRDRYLTKRGGWIEVTSYADKSNVTVRFDNTGVLAVASTFEIRSGTVVDLTIPSVYGVGYLGLNHVRGSHNNKMYSIWQGMLERCYCTVFQAKHPTYIGCTVDKRWLNFSNFTEDMAEMTKESGWELDKDILLKGNRVYSKDTCVFVPKEINLLIYLRSGRDLPSGVYRHKGRFTASCSIEKKSKHLGVFDNIESAFAAYKHSKEAEIQRVAKYWQDKISEKAYNALMNYSIDINDGSSYARMAK